MTKIVIITATLNEEKRILDLIESLNNQNNQNFKWYVIDGNSIDKTLDLIKDKSNFQLEISSKKDAGIYDALNRGISLIKEDYYLVVGSDDYLYKNAVDLFHNSIKTNPDLVFSSWMVGERIIKPGKNLGWLKGMLGVGSSHSVATLIKRSLHNKIGNYNLKFKMCADQLFIKQAYNNKNTYVVRENFISGKFNNTGYSSSNIYQYISEIFLIQISTERFKIFQFILFILRIVKHWKKIIYETQKY